MNITDELQKLQSLREAGALTDDEFNQLKTRVLNHTSQSTARHMNAETANQFIHSITRSRTDSWLGGVCGGLAVKTNMPSWVWRLIFTVGAFAYSVGAIIYLLLWVFVPMQSLSAAVNAEASPNDFYKTTPTKDDNKIIDATPSDGSMDK